MKDRAIPIASPDERRRVERARMREESLAQAQALRLVVRIHVDRATRRLEAELRAAELLAARLGKLTEPVKGGLFSRLLGRAVPGDLVILGEGELKATIEALEKQLERYRDVEGPAAIRRADEAARLLLERPAAEAAPEEPVVVHEALPEAGVPDTGGLDAPDAAVRSKPNGRSTRSPYG